MSESIRTKTAKAAWEAYQGSTFCELARRVKPTAVRNLLAAASEAEVLEELYILFEYQVGRKLLTEPFCNHLRAAIEAQIQALPTAIRSDESARLEVARSYLTHVVRLHRALVE